MPQVTIKENMQFIGIDVSKQKLDVCFSDNKRSSYPNTKNGFKLLQKGLPRPEECIVVLEPTGGYEKRVIVSLQHKSFNVILANALKVRRYAEAMGFLAKNDPIDSYVIKSFGEDLYPKGKLPILLVKTDDFRQLEAWLNRNRQLVKLIATEKQRLEKTTDLAIARSIEKVIRLLEKELKQIDKKIKKQRDKCHLSEQTKILQEVKGIGPVCASAIVTYLPELGHYSNKQIAALVGVAPYCNLSGKFKGKSTIKGGRKTLRSLLYMGILSAITHNPVIKTFYDRLVIKGKHHNVAMVACLRKLLCILNAMFKNKTRWQDDYAAIQN
jgi:transposase